jgi:periplasmic divalent cation tolerance protein
VSDHVVALTTVAKAEDAERIGLALVEQRLAACVNVVAGLTSIYLWKGKVEKDAERLLVMKTRRDRVPELKAALLELHPYELPELVVLPIEDAHAPYLAWIDECVGIPLAHGDG